MTFTRRDNRARISFGNASISASTVRLKVSTDHCIVGQYRKKEIMSINRGHGSAAHRCAPFVMYCARNAAAVIQ